MLVASTCTLAIGDRIIVTTDGKEHLMTVTWVAPPGSFGRSYRAGCRVTASLGPGRWSVDFDEHSTHVTWRPTC